MKSVEAQARELASSTGRSHEDALRLLQLEGKVPLTVPEAAFVLGHPLAVLADSERDPAVTGTTGLGPRLRDVHLGYGTGAFPDVLVVTSIPLPGEAADETLAAVVLHNFLCFHGTPRDTAGRRAAWQEATSAVPVPVEVVLDGTATPATEIAVGGSRAVRLPYLTGQVVIGLAGPEMPVVALTEGPVTAR
ncbi:hypothetical protein [Lentzea sp. NPDC059081]|uniref:hypothetical protein n=1 Tax=Lentzea sp. NPDC059081 TaxID=3346719 RepID=UPI0036815066